MYDKENNIVGFCGVLHWPNAHNKKIKRVTRLVILPDYQGIGLGRKFLNIVSEKYINDGFDFEIMTSAKNLINALVKDTTWKLTRYDRAGTGAGKQTYCNIYKSSSNKRVTATFFKKK